MAALVSLLLFAWWNPIKRRPVQEPVRQRVALYVDASLSMRAHLGEINRTMAALRSLDHVDAECWLFGSRLTRWDLARPLENADLSGNDSFIHRAAAQIQRTSTKTKNLVLSDFDFTDEWARTGLNAAWIRTPTPSPQAGLSLLLPEALLPGANPVSILVRKNFSETAEAELVLEVSGVPGEKRSEAKRFSWTEKTMTVPFSIEAPTGRAAVLRAELNLRKPGLRAVDQAVLPFRNRELEIDVVSYQPDYDEKSVTEILESYKIFSVRSYTLFKPGDFVAATAALPLRPGALLALFSPPRKVLDWAEKSGKTHYYFPLRDEVSARDFFRSDLSVRSGEAAVPETMDFKWDFFQVGVDAEASRKVWRENPPFLKTYNVRASEGMQLFQSFDGRTALFRRKNMVFVGWYPLRNLAERLSAAGGNYLETFVYHLFRTFQDEKGRPAFLNARELTFFLGDEVRFLSFPGSWKVFAAGSPVSPGSVLFPTSARQPGIYPIRLEIPGSQTEEWPVAFRMPIREAVVDDKTFPDSLTLAEAPGYLKTLDKPAGFKEKVKASPLVGLWTLLAILFFFAAFGILKQRSRRVSS